MLVKYENEFENEYNEGSKGTLGIRIITINILDVHFDRLVFYLFVEAILELKLLLIGLKLVVAMLLYFIKLLLVNLRLDLLFCYLYTIIFITPLTLPNLQPSITESGHSMHPHVHSFTITKLFIF